MEAIRFSRLHALSVGVCIAQANVKFPAPVNVFPHPPPTRLHRGHIRGFDVRFFPGGGEIDCQTPYTS